MFNSLLKIKNPDAEYTGGLKFEFYTDYDIRFSPKIKGNVWFKNTDPVDLAGEGVNVNSIYIVGLGFTPNREAFRFTEPVRDQRPFAGYIGIGKKGSSVFSAKTTSPKSLNGRVWNTDLFVGVIGGNGPKAFQNWTHKHLTGSDHVFGCPNQIANGGKVIVNYRLEHLWSLKTTKFDIVSHTPSLVIGPSASLGNLFVNIAAKAAITNQTLQQMNITSGINSNQASESDGPLKWFQWEYFIRPQYVIHNSLLEGLPFADNSVYTIPSQDINRFVFDIGFRNFFQFYAGGLFSKKNKEAATIGIIVELIYRSREYDYTDRHAYGSLGLVFRNNRTN